MVPVGAGLGSVGDPPFQTAAQVKG